jgi:hypothetical protein
LLHFFFGLKKLLCKTIKIKIYVIILTPRRAVSE